MAKKKRYHSIAKRLPIMISVSFAILLTIAVIVTYLHVKSLMIDEYYRMADGVTNLMIDALDPEKMDEYLQENFNSKEYRDIVKYYYKLKDNYPDVYYMYVYRFYKGDVPSGTIIIDLDEEYTENPRQEELELVGTTYTILEPFASKIDELLTSKEPIYETAFDKKDGYLLSLAKPIYDKDGNYVASACVDFSMDVMHKANIRFIASLCLLLILLSVVILLLAIVELRRTIVKPLSAITKAVSEFKYDTEDDFWDNLKSIEDMNLDSTNEIGVLYQAFVLAEKDSLYYMNNFKNAEDEIRSKDVKISELGTLALRDTMTNVGNKAAFTARISEIHDTDQFGIVLMDVNNLKMINDTYGHSAGDDYIKGCCQILCDVYAHSPVFRIGGDEFAVILKGRDYEKRHELMTAIIEKFKQIWRELEYDPVHRFSASLGMADSINCSSTRDVIKTADENMYANKKAFKEQNGSYR